MQLLLLALISQLQLWNHICNCENTFAQTTSKVFKCSKPRRNPASPEMPGFYVCVQCSSLQCSAVQHASFAGATSTQTVNPIQRCQKNTKDAVAEKDAAMQHVCDAE
jgi:hypothetical protein